MSLGPKDILFIGQGRTAVGWYRAYLPAMYLGADWAGVHGEPPELVIATSLVQGETKAPDFSQYKVVVFQQVWGTKWLRLIRKLQDQGIKVLYEVDDYLHGIKKMGRDHDFSTHYHREHLKRVELCMRACDGTIVSTPWLGKKYRKFNPNIFVCENGLDLGRYNLTRPERPTVNIIWAGATGHNKSITGWLEAVGHIMNVHKHVTFVSIGQQYADALVQYFGPRCISIPFTLIEQYPAAMTMGDVAIGPAGLGDFHKAKSDLRWLEAGALGIPIIASPHVYPKITHGVDGFHADNPSRVVELLGEIVTDEELRVSVGQAARRYVHEHRDMQIMAQNWLRVFNEVVV